MKLSLTFLRDLVPTPLDAPAVGDLFTMTGFELEEVFEAEGGPCLDINIMANRGDAASVLGLAREFSARRPEDGRTPLFERLVQGSPRPDDSSAEVHSLAKVRVETPNCTRYAARVFLDVENGPSPEWLQKRLIQCGQRPISLLVDLTNYVMLETGQPLHAFDLDRLAGQEIVVRQAREGEVLATLDGVERTLGAGHMVIADLDKAVAVAGVMGGSDTEVHEGTSRMLLESAHFVSTSIRATRRSLGMQTEASFRFERSVDPAGTAAALNRFADLYEQITGRESVPGVIDTGLGVEPFPAVRLDLARVHRLLGWPLTLEECAGSLASLGFKVELDGSDALWAAPPSWRFDALRAEDLVEDVARIHGYEKFDELAPSGPTPQGGTRGQDAFLEGMVQAALRAGFDQAVSHSLGDRHPLDGAGQKTRVRTPHSPEMAELRISLLPGLCQAVLRNGGRDQGWFEAGRVFPTEGESVKVAFLKTGLLDRPHPEAGSQKATFLSFKGALDAVLKDGGIPDVKWTPAPSPDSRFHPTRTAAIISGGRALGIAGQIHPDAADACGLPSDALLAELDAASCFASVLPKPRTRSISRNPAAARDIALIAPKRLAYSEIEAAIRRAGGENLEDAWLFDIYEGQGVPEGCHSLAVALRFRKMGENYRDEEANQARDAVVAELAALGVTLRQ